MNETCETYELAMTITVFFDTHANEAWHTHERVISHKAGNKLKRPLHINMNKSCHTYE